MARTRPKGVLTETDVSRMRQQPTMMPEVDMQRKLAMAVLKKLGGGKLTPEEMGTRAGQRVRQGVQGLAQVPRQAVQAGQGFFQGLGGATGQTVEPFNSRQRAIAITQGHMRNPPRPRFAPTVPMREQYRSVPKVQDRGSRFQGPMYKRTQPKRRVAQTRNPQATKKNLSDAMKAQIVGRILGL